MPPGLRRLGFLLAIAVCAQAAGFKLYLKDGTYHVVREYKVEADRVHYYSTERSEWEDIPVDLVDLTKTQSEIKSHEDAVREDSKALADEEKAEREAAREISLVPQDPGVYTIDGAKVKPVKEAEPKVVNNKGRHLLKMMSPIPLVTDKSWLEVDGLRSANVVTDPRPEFYFRLAREERFGMVKMGDHKGNRVVEKLTIIPVTKEVVEEPELVETFRKQVGDMVYKIWPEKPLPAGEYALIEYTEGKMNVRVWDFAYSPAK